MERFNALGRGLQLMLVGSVLLLIDLFLDWQSRTVGPFTVTASGVHGFGGVLLLLLSIVLLAWLLVRLAAIEVSLPVSASLIAAFLGFLIVIVAVLKNLVDDYSTWASYLGVLLAILIAVGAWMQVQATGGMEPLRAEASSIMPSTQTKPASSAPTEPVEPEPMEPEAPEPAPPPAPPEPRAAGAPSAESTSEPEAPAAAPEAAPEPAPESELGEPRPGEPEGEQQSS